MTAVARKLGLGLDDKMGAYLEAMATRNPAIIPVLEQAMRRRLMSPANKNRAPSHVYFVQAGKHGLIKIGSASNVSARIAMLQTGCPTDLTLLATSTGGAPAERALHERFAHLRNRGEWFTPAAELLDYVSGLT